jgi:plastocyanin
MTSRLPIFFSVFSALVLCSPAARVAAATVSGKVELEGSKEKRVIQRKDFSSVVVWLEPAGSGRIVTAPRKTVIEQRDKTFFPHVLPISVGSSVEFPNFDPIFHNAFSNFDGQIFDVGLYPPKTTRVVKFNREGIVRVFCNIHPTMSAVIVVLRTGLFDVTTTDGSYRIRDVPPGEYTFKVFHERATESTLQSASRKITIEGEDVVVPGMSISEAGYLASPHKNKYGKNYPAVVKDTVPYGGGPR